MNAPDLSEALALANQRIREQAEEIRILSAFIEVYEAQRNSILKRYLGAEYVYERAN